MVGKFAVFQRHMKVHPGARGNGLKKVLNELCVKPANLRFAPFHTKDEVGPIAQIERHVAERFIHGKEKVAVPGNALFVAQSLGNGFSQSDSQIFHEVVVIDMRIARGFDHQVEVAVLGQGFEHVVHKGNCGFDVGLAPAIKVQLHQNLGLSRIAVNAGLAKFHIKGKDLPD